MKLGSATIFSILLLASSMLSAQGVYVTPGEKGPIFSDKPRPGAREVTLPPLNVIAPPEVRQPPALPDAPGDKLDVATAAYRVFSIAYPENDGSVVANTALFEVRVTVDPPLQLGEGHAVLVSINGRPVRQRFTASEFMLPPEFWGDQLPPPNQKLQLDASIVDGDGRVLKSAAPVRFYLRHATSLNRPKHAVPLPGVPGRSVPLRSAAVPLKAVGATAP